MVGSLAARLVVRRDRRKFLNHKQKLLFFFTHKVQTFQYFSNLIILSGDYIEYIFTYIIGIIKNKLLYIGTYLCVND